MCHFGSAVMLTKIVRPVHGQKIKFCHVPRLATTFWRRRRPGPACLWNWVYLVPENTMFFKQKHRNQTLRYLPSALQLTNKHRHRTFLVFTLHPSTRICTSSKHQQNSPKQFSSYTFCLFCRRRNLFGDDLWSSPLIWSIKNHSISSLLFWVLCVPARGSGISGKAFRGCNALKIKAIISDKCSWSRT
jgi:hypothetical protein